VFFLGWPGYEVPPRYLMEPVGLLYRIRPSSDPMEDDAALWASYHERQVREQATRTEDGFALGVAALYVVSRGERLMFLGDRKGAFALFEEASGLGANVSGIQNYVGTLYGRLGEYDLAIRSFRRALEVKPISLLAWNNLAMAYELAGRREEAKQALRRVIDLAPRDTDAAAALRRLEAATR
jgi:tetratricopeptide (TPR) repeat protein